MRAVSVLSTFLLLSATRVQLASARGSSRDTTLATYNAGLVVGTIGNIDARVTVLIDQMIQSDVDIWCLQEVWEADVQRKIRRDLKDFYPYALSAVDLDSEPTSPTPACDEAGVESFFACRAQHCVGLSGFAYGVCGSIACLEVIASLPEPCRLCLFFEANVVDETECTATLASDYERTYGLMILSNKEIKNPSVHPYNDQSQVRGFLTASVDYVGDLLCTHLTTPIVPSPNYVGPPFVFPFRYTSYAEQHRDEVTSILDYVETVDVPVLMGDFNHGPIGPGLQESFFPFYYGLMNARGFVSPYVLKDGRCTECTELFNTVSDSSIDHIYITTDTTERVVYAKRFYDNVFPSLGTALSDHYGVKVRLTNIRKKCNYVQRYRYHCESEIKQLAPFQPDYSEVCFD